MPAKKLTVQLQELRAKMKIEPENTELKTQEADLIERIKGQLKEVQEKRITDPNDQELITKEAELIEAIKPEEGSGDGDKGDQSNSNTNQSNTSKMSKKKLTKKEIVTAEGYENKEHAFFEIVDTPLFDPYTGEKRKGKVKAPFVTSTPILDLDRFVDFHKRQRRSFTCLYSPEEGGAKAMNEKIAKFKTEAQTKKK